MSHPGEEREVRGEGTPPFLSSPEEIRDLVDSVDTFLLDCDGVIYRGPVVIEGVKDTLSYLRKIGKKIIFVTNNASKSRRQYKATFDKLGIEVSTNEIFGSGYASAVFLKQVLKFPEDKKVYVVGQNGLEEELDSQGIAHVGGTDPEHNKPITQEDMQQLPPTDPSIGAVLCGFDINLNYRKFVNAFSALRDNADCEFILTNQDATWPTAGTIFPGTGAMSYPLIFASKRTPTIVGKPNKTMMDAILADHKFDPSRALMVGDNLPTDIEFGIGSGIRTLLVLSGVTKREQVYGDNPSQTIPTFVIETLGKLAVLAEQ